jgi:hypothetical protein
VGNNWTEVEGQSQRGLALILGGFWGLGLEGVCQFSSRDPRFT